MIEEASVNRHFCPGKHPVFEKTRPTPISRVRDINISIDLTPPVSINALKPTSSTQRNYPFVPVISIPGNYFLLFL